MVKVPSVGVCLSQKVLVHSPRSKNIYFVWVLTKGSCLLSFVIIKSSIWCKNFPSILQRDSRSKFPALLPRPSSKCYIFEMEHIKLICFRQVSFSWVPSPINVMPCKSLRRSLLFFKICSKDNRGLLQKLLSFRYQKPNQIPIEGTVSNPEFEPNQISEPEPDENRSSFDHGEVD